MKLSLNEKSKIIEEFDKQVSDIRQHLSDNIDSFEYCEICNPGGVYPNQLNEFFELLTQSQDVMWVWNFDFTIGDK